MQILFALLLFVGVVALYLTGRKKRDNDEENPEE